jgi:endonuclease/exonuclease/phosphatase family metal-dependent hydrolase
MTQIRIASFNVENLFIRYKFKEGIDPKNAVQEGWKIDQAKFDIFDEADKKITGKTIKALNADVVALQEVEGIDALKEFRNKYLGGRNEFPYVAGIDGNDPRRIDVAVLSRLPLVHVRSHQHILDPETNRFLFSRDCLEVDVESPDKGILILYVNHFKSMIGGRKNTRAKREKQSHKVMDIIIERFGSEPGQHPFVILGDFNDYLETDTQGQSGIDELVTWNQLENVVGRLAEQDRWTHYYDDKDEYRQLDYVLLSKALAESNPSNPLIERRGLTTSATLFSGKRFPGVDSEHSASDHCPVLFELSI